MPLKQIMISFKKMALNRLVISNFILSIALISGFSIPVESLTGEKKTTTFGPTRTRSSVCGEQCAQYDTVTAMDANLSQLVSDYIDPPASDSTLMLGNTPIGCWDTSQVTTMRNLFQKQETFNEDLSCWDTSSVTDMDKMFFKASNFNGDISTWDTSKVTSMSSMFGFAYEFNRDISNWDTSTLFNMEWMFIYAKKFNSDVSSWDVKKVYSFYESFYYAENFSHNLCSWEMNKDIIAYTARYMFKGTSCPYQEKTPIDGSKCYDCGTSSSI